MLICCSIPAATDSGMTVAEPMPAYNFPLTGDNPQMKMPITLKAQNASLPDMLKVFADRSGMNFVTGDIAAKGKISICLNNTPLDEAIDLIVRAAGLSYEITGNSVLVADPDKLNRAEIGQQCFVINLNHANARDVAVMLEKISANIKVDEPGNRLVCFASPRVLNEIQRMVKSIDVPYTMVMMETRLIEAQISKNDQYGIDWAQLTPISTALIHPNYTFAKSWTVLQPVTGPGATPTGSSTGSTTASSGGTAGINLALDLMLSNGNAKLLMDSKLTTTNNKAATLYVGDVYPYEVQAYNYGAQGGGGANISVQKEETGIKIDMEPHVNESHEVTIKINPEVSNVVDFVGTNKDLPHTQVRKTSTTVRVEDGHTIFIAGLIQEQNSVTITRVPLLGSIPLLGLLFQNRKENMVKTNLILEITPHIIQDSTRAGS